MHGGQDDIHNICGLLELQVTSLRELVEDWYFEEGPFMEFVAPALQLLAGLLHNSGELETQLQVHRVSLLFYGHKMSGPVCGVHSCEPNHPLLQCI